MTKKQKPDAEEFARKLLWHLCGLRAESRMVLHMLARHCEPDIKAADAICANWIAQASETQKKLYDEATKAAAIPRSKAS